MDTIKHEGTVEAFFALVRAGLWEKAGANHNLDVKLYEKVEWEEVYQLAEEQSVIGVVLAGIEHSNVKPPQELLLQWIGEVQILEQQNKSMNQFIAELVERLRKADIYTLLVKGQGIAQCYERPLWRACGDVDFFLSDSSYDKAKAFLMPLASTIEPEGIYKRHFEMVIEPWVVELHGSMRSGLSSSVDNVIDETQYEVFNGGNVRSWMDGKTQVFLPGVNCDVIFVFTHFIKHFYCEGLGLRQICDWCRLLWTYRDSLNHGQLEYRIRRAGLMSEWKVFASFAVEYLGMPVEAMPLFNENDSKNHNLYRKAELIKDFVMEVGNMGHNRDTSYFEKYPYLIRKVCSLRRRCWDLIRHAKISPQDSFRFFPNIMLNGLKKSLMKMQRVLLWMEEIELWRNIKKK